MTILFVDLHDN